MALDFPVEQLRLLFYLLETQKQSQREEIGQGEMADASVLWGKKRQQGTAQQEVRLQTRVIPGGNQRELQK